MKLIQFDRQRILNKLISLKDNGDVKIITGIRRCGKTYLLFNLFYEHLISSGIKEENIIKLSLEDSSNEYLRNYDNFYNFLKTEIAKRKGKCYILIDEIQLVKSKISKFTKEKLSFHFIIIEFMKVADIYVTGSNSKMLSSDIITEFRGRGNQLKIYPLTFSEYYEAFKDKKTKEELFDEYINFGGLPRVALIDDKEIKADYLKSLFDELYLKDIIEKNKIHNNKELIGLILDLLSSNVGSLTNPLKISNTLNSVSNLKISQNTTQKYIDMLEDSFLIYKTKRYDIKGKRILSSPYKYYFSDLGIKNVRVNILQSQEMGHIYENIIYNELISRGFEVNVGVVEHFIKDEQNKTNRVYYEIDFIAQKHGEKYYIQSAMSVENDSVYNRETRGLNLIKENFKKIIITNKTINNSYDKNGFLFLSIIDFLLDENLIRK